MASLSFVLEHHRESYKMFQVDYIIIYAAFV